MVKLDHCLQCLCPCCPESMVVAQYLKALDVLLSDLQMSITSGPVLIRPGAHLRLWCSVGPAGRYVALGYNQRTLAERFPR
jgi:hypothetical protein